MSCGTVFSNAPLQSDIEKKCLRTQKTIHISCFDVNPKTGTAYSSCVVCLPKNRTQQKAYNKTEKGKAKNKIKNAKPEVKQAKADWIASEHGIQKVKERTNTDKYRMKCSKFSKTVAGKAIRKRTYQKHKAATGLMNGIARVIRGENSPTTIASVAFNSPQAVRNHFRRLLADTSMKLIDHGSKWTVEHKIPKSAYDHANKADVLRCWSAANMTILDAKSNKEKWNSIIVNVVTTVPKEFWPQAWNGVIPQ